MKMTREGDKRVGAGEGVKKHQPFPLFLVGDFSFLLAIVFSRNLLRWKVIKFHIIQACSKHVAARQLILKYSKLVQSIYLGNNFSLPVNYC